MEELLERLLEECRPFTSQGRAADYIPELAKADTGALGVYVIGSEGKHSWAGDCRRPFTIQSVVKPILLLQALLDNGAEFVMKRVGVEAVVLESHRNWVEKSPVKSFQVSAEFLNGHF